MKSKTMFLWQSLLCVPLLLCCWQPVFAQETAEAEKNATKEFDLELQLRSFDQVWETIKSTHWDKKLVGESWDQARDKYRPRVESAKDIKTVRDSISEMLNSLEQSHFAIIPSNAYVSAQDEDSPGGTGTVGVEIRLIEDRLVVTRVRRGFPAEQAGVQPGWIVKLIGGRTSDELLKIATQLGKQSVVRLDTAVGLVCDGRTSGPPGGKLAFAMIDNDDQVRLMEIELAKPPGKAETFGNLPATHIYFDSEVLPDDIGYVAFNAFLGAPRLIREYNKAIKDYRDKKGLVIDLRGNRGGIVMLVTGMCNWLTTDKSAIGKMSMTGGNSLNLTLNPRKPRFEKPVALLTDACSISAAEIMAGGVKDLKLGRVFGGTTAGLSLPSTVVRLPNGDRFQYAISAYHSASGESIENQGVIPDQEIKLTRELIQKESDPVLAAATRWILEQNND